jgi:hypothetical protein
VYTSEPLPISGIVPESRGDSDHADEAPQRNCPSTRLPSVDRYILRAPAAFPTRKRRLGPTRALRRSSGQEVRTREKRRQSRRQSRLFSQTGPSLENSNGRACERRSRYLGFHDACRLRGSVEPSTFRHSLPPARHSRKKNPVPSIAQICKCFLEGQGVISFKLWTLTVTLSGRCPVLRAS